ncbi:HD-GYP domain-containing protein [Alkalihalophilus sp. As8PL]|uniref:HD-GYP domain-containing protein n=1 Tax=Alkalihalophilus sp. As8PL TaxID=3237103 RepID=A0AB39BPF9_9BACI
MKITPNQLIEGCILSVPIMGHTDTPIVKENTVLNANHISAIKSFLVPIVEVESTLANGEKFKPQGIIYESNKEIKGEVKKEKKFIEIYNEAVKQYRKLYIEWQSGKKVEMIYVRKCLTPLFEYILDHPKELLTIHHLSKVEEYIYHHSVSVGCLAAFIAKKLHYSKRDWLQVGIAGALCDAGMSKVPSKILMKKGPLSKFEFNEIKKHPVHSYNMLKEVTGVSNAILLSVLQHHERIDRSGYPLRSDKKKLHTFSQVIAVADVFHAMTSERIYSKKQSPYDVLNHLCKDHFGRFEHRIIQTFCESFSQLSIGARVRLKSGVQAEIIFFNNQRLNNPMLKLLHTGEIFELNEDQSLQIEVIV